MTNHSTPGPFAGHVPPHDLQAEAAALGALLLNPDALIDVAERSLGPDDFYKPAHAHIFAAIQALAARGEPIDAVTVSTQLASANLLDAIGGSPTLIDLQAQTPATSNAGHYATIITRNSRLRRLISTARDIIDTAMASNQGEVEDIIQAAEQAIYDVSNDSPVTRTNTVATYALDTLADIDLRAANPGVIRGVATGFADYDQLLSGYQPGTLNIVAARPAMGKSAFAASVSTHAAIKNNKTVALFTLEMSAVETLKRFVSAYGRINANHIRTGHLKPGERDDIGNTIDTLAATNLYLNESSATTIASLRSESRRVAAKAGGIDLIVIDYLQLMDTTGTNNASTREREVAAQSRGLKLLAKELNVPVVCLAQVNRGVEHRTDKRPSLADLRESGAIEADADTVTFLYRDEIYTPDTPDRGLAELIVAKHRAGPTGTVKVAFLPQYTSFENLAQHAKF